MDNRDDKCVFSVDGVCTVCAMRTENGPWIENARGGLPCRREGCECYMVDFSPSKHFVVGPWEDLVKVTQKRQDERPTGTWEPVMDSSGYPEKDEMYDTVYRCSVCGAEIIGTWNYCPECGTKMEE